MPITVTSALTPGNTRPLEPGRSLVPLQPTSDVENSRRYLRPSAAFLAQLIAAAQGAPQSRARRRLAPAAASAVYAAVASGIAPAGRLQGSL